MNGQCIFPSGSYSWGLSEVNDHITNNCGAAPLSLVVPTDATINIQNNDVWDLISHGAITITIQGMGSLVFNGVDQLLAASGSELIIESNTNTNALVESGNGTNIRI